MAQKQARLPVRKTYKLFIGGKFVRSESGRVATAETGGRVIASFSRASRKDFRDAVLAARAALGAWSKQSAYLRGQMLYRAAELLEDLADRRLVREDRNGRWREDRRAGQALSLIHI